MTTTHMAENADEFTVDGFESIEFEMLVGDPK